MATNTTAYEPRNGSLNKVMLHDRAAHEWYRFVLSFPPHLVRQYLDRFEIDASRTVLDPFCGTGTTLVECKKRGITSVGIGAHPMAHFPILSDSYSQKELARRWEPRPASLLDGPTRVKNLATKANATEVHLL
jgi:hypothetical protein